MNKNIESRPRQVLRDIGRVYPNAWKQVKMFREDKGKDLPNWADWCYLPIAAGVAIATGGIDERLLESGVSDITNPATVTAAATWKLSQGVYRFDYDLYDSLTNQPMDDKLPCEALKRLPEYCVYIETYNAKWGENLIDGFFAHLEQDMNDFREELRFVFLLKDGRNIPFAIHLGDWSLDEGLQKMQDEAKKQASIYLNMQLPYMNYSNEIVPFLQLVLYLCAENIDVSVKPVHPQKKVKRNGVIEATKAPKMWNVGQRIGNTIRKYRNAEVLKHEKEEIKEKTEQEEKEDVIERRTSPRPHIRRGHWATYWTGSRSGKQTPIIKWLPPTPVGVNKDDDSPVVIHRVE